MYPFTIILLFALAKTTEAYGEIEELAEIFDARIEDERNRTNAQLNLLAARLNDTLSQIAKLETKIGQLVPPKNCEEILKRGQAVTGVYYVKPDRSLESFEVLCNMVTRGGGWTYILNRFDGSQDFSLNWEGYKRGFGDFSKEFWLGLKHLHELTSTEDNELLIELVDWDNKQVYALYDSFKIGTELEGYPIKALGKYSGDAGDSFHNHTYMKFSTKDVDQDRWYEGSCAGAYSGGWWYNRCHETLLTGPYFKEEGMKYGGITWKEFRGYDYNLKEARMMIRPSQHTNNVLFLE